MASRKNTKPFVSINAVDLSDSFLSAGWTEDAASLIEKTKPSTRRREFYEDPKISAMFEGEYLIDYDTGKTMSTIGPLIGKRTEVVYRPDTAAISATNPSSTFNVIITSTGRGGQNETEDTHAFAWQIDGSITQATS